MTVVIVWVALTAVGTIVAVGLFIDAMADLRALRLIDVVNGRGVIARARVRSATTRLFVLSTWFGVGVFALLPYLGLQPHPVTVGAVRAGLVAAAVAYVWDGVAESRVRGNLLAANEKDDDEQAESRVKGTLLRANRGDDEQGVSA